MEIYNLEKTRSWLLGIMAHQQHRTPTDRILPFFLGVMNICNCKLDVLLPATLAREDKLPITARCFTPFECLSM
jgi:hypothetical protein